MDSWKLVGIAALFALSGLLWVGFVRRGPERTALGTVASKGYMAGKMYVQQPVGANRGFNTPTNIEIPESNVFELRLDGIAEPVRASFNTVKGRQFEVGQRVRVQYVRRGFPPLWQRIGVVDMTPADSVP
jgi:hypothetical protein